MTDQHILRLQQHKALSQIKPDVIQELAAAGDFVTLERPDAFCTIGEPESHFFLLLNGQVRLLDAKRRRVMLMSELEGHFGYNRYEDDYPFTVIPHQKEATVFRISKENLRDFYNRFPQFRNTFYIYRVPIGAHQFFRTFKVPNFNLEYDSFLTSFELEYIAPHQAIVTKGDEADKFYMVLSGQAKVTINAPEEEEKVVGHILSGDYFGEVALLKHSTRTASVIAENEMFVLSISKQEFEKFITTPKGKLIAEFMLERINTYSASVEDTIIGRSRHCKPRLDSDKIAPEHIKLTKMQSKDGSIRYQVKPLVNNAKFKVFLNKQLIESERIVELTDEIALGDYKIVFDRKGGFAVQKSDFYHLYVEHLHWEIDGKVILDDVSFDAESGQMVAVMGPSGCGKSTVLEMIYGNRQQTSGTITYNNDPLRDNLEYFRQKFGYVPQDDILFGELTVFENLLFTARIREPLAALDELEIRIDDVLESLKLSEFKHARVGTVESKGLSGGQRKRVNIARELIFDPKVIFLDEPTSGLSSKDSEEIVAILRNLGDMGKLVFVVLHQPSSKIYKSFDRILFLDKGGRTVYFGDVIECIEYMQNIHEGYHDPVECPTCQTTHPEVLFDILEEKDEHNKRRYSPEFWAERYKKFRESHNVEAVIDEQAIASAKITNKLTIKEHVNQFITLLHRVTLTKINNRNNMILSFAAPTVISLLISMILYSTDADGNYSFYDNKLLLIYLFIGVIFAIFMGLTNSVRDIVSERAIYSLEHKNRLRVVWYVLSKFAVMAVIAAIQSTIFVSIGNQYLEIQGMFWPFFQFIFLVSLFGIAFGLFLSSIVNSSESVVNWIPLILIPQIILGGALIKFEDMSRDLYLDAQSVIPEIGQIIPSRWTHEAMVIAQVAGNPFDRALSENNEALQRLNEQIREYKRLGPAYVADIEKVRDARKKVRAERSQISSLYPAKLNRNKVLEDAALNGNGRYQSERTRITTGKPVDQYGSILVYEIRDGIDDAPFLNAPFYAESKGITIGSTYYEFPTTLFNTLILLLMIVTSLLLCTGMLKLRG